MQTLFILEFQANNNGTCAMTAPLGFQVENQTQENAMIARYCLICASAAEANCDTDTVQIVNSDGEVWHGYKQVFRHSREES